LFQLITSKLKEQCTLLPRTAHVLCFSNWICVSLYVLEQSPWNWDFGGSRALVSFKMQWKTIFSSLSSSGMLEWQHNVSVVLINSLSDAFYFHKCTTGGHNCIFHLSNNWVRWAMSVNEQVTSLLCYLFCIYGCTYELFLCDLRCVAFLFLHFFHSFFDEQWLMFW